VRADVRRGQRHRDGTGVERAEEPNDVRKVLSRRDRDPIPRLHQFAELRRDRAHVDEKFGPGQGPLYKVMPFRAVKVRIRRAGDLGAVEQALHERGPQNVFGDFC
jgi:hypothetical protein